MSEPTRTPRSGFSSLGLSATGPSASYYCKAAECCPGWASHPLGRRLTGGDADEHFLARAKSKLGNNTPLSKTSQARSEVEAYRAAGTWAGVVRATAQLACKHPGGCHLNPCKVDQASLDKGCCEVHVKSGKCVPSNDLLKSRYRGPFSLFLDWSVGDEPVAWADYYIFVAAATSDKTKTLAASKRRASQLSETMTSTSPRSSPTTPATMDLSSPSPDRPHNSCDTNGDTTTAAHPHPISPAASNSQPQQKRPRLSAALIEKRTKHQQERDATQAYFRHLQDELDRQKAERVAELDARQRLLRAEEETAQQAYAEAARAGEAWISKCTMAATDRMHSDDTAAATAQLASQLRELLDEYTQASWRTLIEGDEQASLLDTVGAPDDTARSALPVQPAVTLAPVESVLDVLRPLEPTTITPPQHASADPAETVVPPVSVEGHSDKDSLENGARSIERQPSSLLDDGYQDDDERARLAQVRTAHPHLSIPALRLVAAAAAERVVSQLPSSKTP